eukprot:6216825-Karenia_brevis.AAC.1
MDTAAGGTEIQKIKDQMASLQLVQATLKGRKDAYAIKAMDIASAELKALKIQLTASKPLPDQLNVVRKLAETKQRLADQALCKLQEAQAKLTKANQELAE